MVFDIPDIQKALREEVFARQGGRLLQTGVRGALKALDEPEPSGFTRITLDDPQEGGRLGAIAIVPSQFEAQPALFDLSAGGFQLGTYLKIENDGLRLLVDILADPLNLVSFGTMSALTKTGKLGRLVSSAIRAGEAGGKSVKTVADAFEGVENIVKLVGGGEDYLRSLSAAAQKGGLRGGEFKALIDKGLAAEGLTDEAADVLRVLRKDRKAFLDLHKVATDFGQRKLSRELVLQPTLLGRLKTGQVRPLVSVDKPFALTRALVGQPYGDVMLWSPAALDKLAGSAGDAYAKRFKPDSLVQRVSKATPDDLIVDGGGDLVFSKEGAELAGDLQIAELLHGGSNADIPAQLEGQLGLDAFDDAELLAAARGLIDATGAEITPDVLRARYAQLAAQKGVFDDTARVKAANEAATARMSALKEAAQENAERRVELGLMEREAIDGYVSEVESSMRMVYATRSVESLLGDEAMALNIEAQRSIQAVTSQMHTSIMGEMIERSVGGKKRKRAVEFFRSFVKHPLDTPGAFERDAATGVYRLVDDTALASVREGAPELDRILRIGEADMPGITKRLQEEGLGPGMSLVADSMGRMNAAVGSRLAKEQLIKAEEVNYFRRAIRVVNSDVDKEQLVLQFQNRLNDPAEETIVKAYADARKLAKTGKARESVQIARKATEDALLALEREGIIEINRDALSAFADGMASSHRALLLNDFMETISRNRSFITRDMLARLNDTADIELPILKWFKAGRSKIDLDLVPKQGLPEAFPFGATERQAWETVGLGEDLFKKLYVKVDLPEEYARVGPLAEITAEAWSGLSKRALDSGPVRRKVRQEIVDRLVEDPAYREKLLGAANPKYRNGRSLTREDYAELALGKSRRALKSATAKKARESVSNAIDQGVRATASKAASEARSAPEAGFYVLRGMEGNLREAFGLIDKEKIGKGMSRYLNANRKIKGIVLNSSFFHYNVIQAAGIIANPTAQARLLASPLAKGYRSELLAKQFAGATGGALGGAALGEDEEGALAGGLMGLMWMTGIGAAAVNAKVAKKFMLAPEFVGTYARMGRAGWHGAPDDRSIGFVAGAFKRLSDDLKANHRGKLRRAIYDGVFDVQADFERTMWDFAHNGQKTLAYHHAFARLDDDLLKRGLKPDTEAWAKAQLEGDREITNVVNSAFGGHNAARLWNDPRWQKLAQGVLLSPDWTVGNLLGAGNIFLNQSVARSAVQGALVGQAAEAIEAGFDLDHMTGTGALGGAVVGAGLGRWARRSMSRFLSGGGVAKRESVRLYRNALMSLAFYGNLANYAATGHFMWDNPEGKKLSVALPGGETYLSFGKPYLESLEFASAIDAEKFDRIIASRAASKIAPLPRLFVQVATGRDNFGQPIVRATDNPLEGLYHQGTAYLSTISPIVLQRPLRTLGATLAGREENVPGAFARAGLGAAGFAVSQAQGLPNIDRAVTAAFGAPVLPQLPTGNSLIGN